MANPAAAAAAMPAAQAAMRAQLMGRMRPQLPAPGMAGLGPAAGGMANPAAAGAANPAALQAYLAQFANPALQGAAPAAGPGMGFARGGKVRTGRDRQFGESVEEPEPVKKARGGGIKLRRPKGPKPMAAKQPVSTPSPYDYEADEGTAPSLPSGPGGTPPVAGPLMAKGGKFIQKAIKHPGALHRQLGVAQGKKIPAGKLAKAAKAPGKLGQRARLAETLKGLHKAKGGECKDKMAAGGAAKQRKGFPNTIPPPKGAGRYANGGKVRGCGIATKGCRFSGIY
jgi:hypothetical protein